MTVCGPDGGGARARPAVASLWYGLAVSVPPPVAEPAQRREDDVLDPRERVARARADGEGAGVAGLRVRVRGRAGDERAAGRAESVSTGFDGGACVTVITCACVRADDAVAVGRLQTDRVRARGGRRAPDSVGVEPVSIA